MIDRFLFVGAGGFIRMHCSLEDPAKFEGSEEGKLAKFPEVRDQIEERIWKWVVEQYIFAGY